MADEWIKWTCGLLDKPEVLRMAAALNVCREVVACRLMRFWEWCDANVPKDAISPDGSAFVKLSPSRGDNMSFVDALVATSGFADALALVKWITFRNDGIELPNFGSHNGETAKTRARNARNQRQKRREGKEPPQDVTEMSPARGDKLMTRVEERREERNTVVNTETQDAAASSVPVVSKTPRAKPFTKPTVSEVVAYVVEIGSAVDARQFVDYYEANGWRVGKNAMKDWRAAVRQWEARRKEAAGYAGRTGQHGGVQPTAAERRERLNASGFDWIEHAAAERERAEAAAGGNGRGYLPAGD